MSEKKEPSQRQLRVGQEVRKILASMIEKGEIRNLQAIDTLVTITNVKISPDLKYAFVYLMTSNYLRKQVGAKLQLRYAPELVFKIDDTFEQVDYIEKLLRDPKVQKDLQAQD